VTKNVTCFLFVCFVFCFLFCFAGLIFSSDFPGISIIPETEGKWEWIDPKTLEFAVKDGFKFSTEYVVKVAFFFIFFFLLFLSSV